MKSKYVAAALAICLGGLGAHKFYLGKKGQGVLYLFLLLVWIWIPVILGIIEGIMYLTKSQADFDAEYNYAVRAYTQPTTPTTLPSSISSTPKSFENLSESSTSVPPQSDSQGVVAESAQLKKRPSKSIDNIRTLNSHISKSE